MKKTRILLLFFMLVLAACSQPREDGLPPTADDGPSSESQDGLDPDKQQAFDQLVQDLGQVPEILIQHGISRFIAPQFRTEISDPETAVRDFFNTYAPLFGLDNPDLELLIDSVRQVDGGNLVRFAQYLNGLPVYAAETVSLLTNQNTIAFVSGALQPSEQISTDPGIDAQAAIVEAVERSGDAFATVARDPQLVFFSPRVLGLSDDATVLAWELALLVDQFDGGPPLRTQYLIDANSGDLLFEVLEEAYEENWNIYDAQNAVTGDPTPKRTLAQAVLIYENKNGVFSTILDSSGNLLSDAEGTIAQMNMAATWDYFFDVHSWDGHDDKGGVCNIYVNVGVNWGNASCGPKCNCRFGDRTSDWAVPLDVLAHEFTHAITGQTAKLKYKNESGAVNEHFSDFFATMIETMDWLQSNPEGFRDLRDPSLSTRLSGWPAFPDHYDEVLTSSFDNGNVHFNSSILNKAAFMVADTGTNTHPDSNITVGGFGRAKAEQIWFQALLSGSPTTGLQEMAGLLVQSAQSLVGELLTQEEACEVQKAMQAVGLRELNCICDDELECPPGIIAALGQGSESVEPTPAASACDHPYMPIRVGSKWSYIDSDGAEFDLEVLEINEVNGVHEAKVQQILEFQEETIIIDYIWQCKPEGIDMLMAAIFALPFNLQGSIDYSTEGVSLPKESDLDTGATWEFSYTIQFQGIAEGQTVDITNEREENYIVQGHELVSLPAGDFNALEILSNFESTITVFNFTRSFPGQQILWFAEGVGLVKNQVDRGEDGLLIMELIDYDIP